MSKIETVEEVLLPDNGHSIQARIMALSSVLTTSEIPSNSFYIYIAFCTAISELCWISRARHPRIFSADKRLFATLRGRVAKLQIIMTALKLYNIFCLCSAISFNGYVKKWTFDDNRNPGLSLAHKNGKPFSIPQTRPLKKGLPSRNVPECITVNHGVYEDISSPNSQPAFKSKYGAIREAAKSQSWKNGGKRNVKLSFCQYKFWSAAVTSQAHQSRAEREDNTGRRKLAK